MGIQKIYGSSGKHPAYPETFKAIRKFSPETFQAIRKLSGQSGKYPDYLEIFQRVLKLPIAISGVTRKNFPDTQKLSGWQCHPTTQVFGPLGTGSLEVGTCWSWLVPGWSWLVPGWS